MKVALVFACLADAVRQGWSVYDRQGETYLVRKFVRGRWVLAIAGLTDPKD